MPGKAAKKEEKEEPPQEPVPPPEPAAVVEEEPEPVLRWDQVVYGAAPSGGGRCNHSAASIGATTYFIGGYDGTAAHLKGDAAVAALQLRPSASWVAPALPPAWTGKGKEQRGFSRSQLCCCAVDGVLYIVGGWDGHARGHPLLAYDPQEGSLTEVDTGGESPAHLTFAAATAVGPRCIVFGGCGRQQESTTWTLDLSQRGEETLMWSSSSANGAVPPPRSSHAMATVAQRAWLFGGRDPESQPLGDMHCYDVDLSSGSAAASTWGPAPAAGGDPPQPRFGHSMAAVGSVLYVFGGSCGGWKLLSDLRRVDVAAAGAPGGAAAALVWEEVRVDPGPGLSPSPRAYHAMAAAETALCIFGGRVDAQTPALADVWTLETQLTADGAADDTGPAASESQGAEDALAAEEAQKA